MKIFEVTREQFFEYFPPETRNIVLNDEVIPSIETDIVCDRCNAYCGIENENGEAEHIFMISHKKEPQYIDDISYVLCKKCAMKLIKNEKIKKSKGEIL